MRTLKAGATYFLVVFGAGFVLGPIRILWVVPQLGMRTAELLEVPIMLIVIFLAARWLVRRFSVPLAVSARLGMGFVALALLLVTELTLVLWLRGMSIREYVVTRDPISGTAYLIALGIFAVMPLFVARK
jgi:hypothetical protein